MHHPAKAIVFFDGHCVLCSGFARWLAAKKHRKPLHLATLQAQAASQYLGADRIARLAPSTIVFYDHGQIFTRSDAVLNILRYVRGVYRLMYVLKVVPRFVRDGLYQFVARNRYRWFGSTERCMVPPPALRHMFLE